MSKEHIERIIRLLKGVTHSTDEQIEIAHAMASQGVYYPYEGIKRAELEDELGLDLDYNPKTSLRHLEEIGLVEEYKDPGVDVFAIATWRDTNGVVNGAVDEAAEEALEAVIDHVQDDDVPSPGGPRAVTDGGHSTVRGVVADCFDLAPDAVEGHLRRPGDKVDRLNEVVEAIEEEDDVDARDDYGEIIFVNRAYKYRLSVAAARLYEL